MSRRILIIDGHPDRRPGRFIHALAEAYATGAAEGGHESRRIEVGALDFPLLRTKEDFDGQNVHPAIKAAEDDLAWADHLVLLYPLWLGAMPALLKGFLEQVFRPGFAFSLGGGQGGWKRALKGKSARIVVTMGMPALVYRWYFGAHGLKSLERSILGFAGIRPIGETLIGMVETMSDAKRARWLAKLAKLGRAGR
jgi:putative NADPH-quinone reductase